MNLLPKSHQEFSKADYWNTFFKKRGKKAFEWYGEFSELSSDLLKYVRLKDNILHVGCGNSTLGMDLYDIGYENIENIDVSPVVIKQMQETNKEKRPNLIFKQMDATKMNYEDDKFSVVIDKGTLDALMPDNNEETVELITKYFEEIKRVLRNTGRYICISLLQEHIVKILIEKFSSSFALRVIRCHDAEIKARENDESPMPVFIVVATKFSKLPQPILEIVLSNTLPVRLSSTEDLVENIKSTQESASLCNSLAKSSVANEGEIFFDLHLPGGKEPRYSIYILDQLMAKERTTYAAFVVPQGRESEWLFSTKEGRQQLLKSARHDRLAIIILRRGQEFESLQAVQNELADCVKNFAPSGLVKKDIPFLSIGSDIGNRKVCYEGKSDISGPFVVEEIETENCKYRRLIFLNNQFTIQSEARLKQALTRRKKIKYVVDHNFVACNHHLYMSVGLKTALKNKESGETLIVGLGGGGLCTFIRQYIPQTKVTAVEIDEAVLKIATEYFDLVQDERLKVDIDDGIEYLKNSAKQRKKYEAILFDVDSKDTSVGMSCPPKQFVEPEFLKIVEDCLDNDGFFILNLVARDEKVHDQVVDNLKKCFKFISSYKVLEEVNEIIFCCKNEKEFKKWKKSVEESAIALNKHAKTKNLEKLFDVTTLLNSLKIV